MFPIHDENPVRIVPYVTYAFMVACILAFVWQITQAPALQNAIVYALGVIPAVLFGGFELDPELVWVPPTLTVFTSMFLHGGWMHLIGNMLYLWVFGNNIEAAMGRYGLANTNDRRQWRYFRCAGCVYVALSDGPCNRIYSDLFYTAPNENSGFVCFRCMVSDAAV